MPATKLLTICGSLRKLSYNRMLLAEAVKAFGSADVIEADLNLPLYDGDLEASQGIPEKVQLLACQIKEADAILIGAPEYNKGISGVLKNTLDWISRVPGEPAFSGKPTVVLSAAAGRTGGETAQFMTLTCLIQLQAKLIPGAMVLVAAAHNEFDEKGHLANDCYKAVVREKMDNLRNAL